MTTFELGKMIDYYLGRVIVSVSDENNKYIEKIIVKNGKHNLEFSTFTDFMLSCIENIKSYGNSGIDYTINYNNNIVKDLLEDISKYNNLFVM